MAAGDEKGGADFYAVLGLSKECSEADLKNAYKKLALRWHPDRCSASGNSNSLKEAKEKFQEIQAAYSVLSDSNKRFLYDVGVYDNDDDDDDGDDDENVQGMGDFLGEMAQMMSQTNPCEKGNESLEELQQLFVDMFEGDFKMGFNGDPVPKYKATNGYECYSSSSSSASPSPPPWSISGGIANKRGSTCMSSGTGKAKLHELDTVTTGFCFGFGPSQGTGGSNSKRRSGRKQKISSKHDVSC